MNWWPFTEDAGVREITTTQLEELSGQIINRNQMEALAKEEPKDTNSVWSSIKPEHLWASGPI